jgi:predicted DNA-binding transcriptional regulator YafY
VPGLDESELRALLMAQPRALGDSRLAHAAERALGKLMASLPATMREQAASIRQRLHVDSAGWRGTSENLSMLPVVQDAVSRDRRLAITYFRRGGECVERTVDPLGLVAKGSSWYLVARTLEGFRTYRVSRIEQATLLELPSERPADFDLAAYWTDSAARFEEALPRYRARLRIEPQTARWLKMWRASWSEDPETPPRSDGWVTLRMAFDTEDEACFVVLGLGRRVDVLEPDALRTRVAAEAAAVIARIQEGGTA